MFVAINNNDDINDFINKFITKSNTKDLDFLVKLAGYSSCLSIGNDGKEVKIAGTFVIEEL